MSYLYFGLLFECDMISVCIFFQQLKLQQCRLKPNPNICEMLPGVVPISVFGELSYTKCFEVRRKQRTYLKRSHFICVLFRGGVESSV